MPKYKDPEKNLPDYQNPNHPKRLHDLRNKKVIIINGQEKQGVSLRKLAKDTGIGRTTLDNAEDPSKNYHLSVENLLKLARYYSVTLDYLLCRTDDPTGTTNYKSNVNAYDIDYSNLSNPNNQTDDQNIKKQ